MSSTNRPGREPDPAAPGEDPEIAVMAQNGITRTPANHYHVDGYRYASLTDALAQAKRGAASREAGK
jgi:hypothetical protein